MAWEVAFVVFLISLTVLVFLTIPVVMRLKDTLKKVNHTLDVLNKDLPEIMDNIADISDTLTGVTEKIESTVNDVAQLEQLVSKEIKQPLQNIANSIGLFLQLANRLFERKKSK
ncbi:MAG TPA: DUF948 domain-containing protein [Caldithrix abyssi]|uniref:DUF948 domain-containing protein n=1 Tax=Caldithrix abyssi TaxID=187145 RepID=A0A7V5UED4_CALAY|nr:DUF948 domain-containing protein [Caldithrix abyssi]